MKTSDSIKSISKALLAFQAKVTTVKKDGKNPHFQNTYASIEAVLHAVMPILNANGIVMTQGGEPTEKDGIAVSTRLTHAETGEYIETTMTLPMVKNDPQAGGSAVTYARRYSLLAMLGLGAEDDDANNATPAPTPAPQAQTPGNTTGEICKDCGANRVLNPKTGKMFCEKKCWLTPKPEFSKPSDKCDCGGDVKYKDATKLFQCVLCNKPKQSGDPRPAPEFRL